MEPPSPRFVLPALPLSSSHSVISSFPIPATLIRSQLPFSSPNATQEHRALLAIYLPPSSSSDGDVSVLLFSDHTSQNSSVDGRIRIGRLGLWLHLVRLAAALLYHVF